MNREDLEHIIRAAADITNEYEFVVVGSQSILGPIPNPPAIFTMSAEADIYPLNAIHKADEIDAAIGEGSRFHETYGYYAQGVGPETACLPAGWQSRLQRIQTSGTNGRVAYCLDVLDLFMAKAAADRDKDRVFCMALIQHGYVSPDAAINRVNDMPMERAAQGRLRARIKRWTKALREQGHEIPGDAA
ncbi:hypothetical protein KZ686_24385 [Cupriavidus cauae]|jgi:hypothetical protein|uniref:DUF6036 domain-containing protein n=1 Tax=Cupriavidus cauae TaxID=2608999 RepID=A0A5M8AB44_9BURK|nr:MULTISPECIES: DUF6036 family nucleotidyltransferase [Cupriavidus]KAA0178591.1 hypothetical protein FX016_24185 [Cupriavidus gilardii]KAA6121008.1 hypothetical protein F1599_17855 [Cupriavidus cauae]MCA7082527.1 hypothetical protein [Cupriavidus sp. DB3]UZN51441.1 hypothetical protein KZ686_24385 [Cupriavidus cauae]